MFGCSQFTFNRSVCSVEMSLYIKILPFIPKLSLTPK